MLNTQNIHLKNIIFTKLIAYLLMILFLGYINNLLYLKLSEYKILATDNKIFLKDMKNRIKFLKNNPNNLQDINQYYPDLLNQQTYQLCLNKINIIHSLNDILSSSKLIYPGLKAEVILQPTHLVFTSISNNDIVDIVSLIQYEISDLVSLLPSIYSIMSIMPYNTQMVEVKIENNASINPSNISKVILRQSKEIYKILLKLVTKQVQFN